MVKNYQKKIVRVNFSGELSEKKFKERDIATPPLTENDQS